MANGSIDGCSVYNEEKCLSCDDGYAFDDGTCKKCNAGTYAIAGSAACSPCGANQISAAGATSCTLCESNQHSVDHVSCANNINGCNNYSSNSVCSTCGKGYTKLDSSCMLQVENCISHFTTTAEFNALGYLCKTCAPGYVRLSNSCLKQLSSCPGRNIWGWCIMPISRTTYASAKKNCASYGMNIAGPYLVDGMKLWLKDQAPDIYWQDVMMTDLINDSNQIYAIPFTSSPAYWGNINDSYGVYCVGKAP